MSEVISHLLGFLKILKNEMVWLVSLILTTFLSAIGYPKEIIVFIFVLVIADVISRMMAEVYKKYKTISLYYFVISWKGEDKTLSSKKLKYGLFAKIFFYGVFLYVANQTSIIPEVICGQAISTFLYSMIVVIEFSSILENSIDLGFKRFKPILQFFNKKRDELVGENIERNDTPVE